MSLKIDPIGDIQRFITGLLPKNNKVPAKTISTTTNRRLPLNGFYPRPSGPPQLTSSYPPAEIGKILPWASGPYGTGAKHAMAGGPGERVF